MNARVDVGLRTRRCAHLLGKLTKSLAPSTNRKPDIFSFPLYTLLIISQLLKRTTQKQGQGGGCEKTGGIVQGITHWPVGTGTLLSPCPAASLSFSCHPALLSSSFILWLLLFFTCSPTSLKLQPLFLKIFILVHHIISYRTLYLRR